MTAKMHWLTATPTASRRARGRRYTFGTASIIVLVIFGGTVLFDLQELVVPEPNKIAAEEVEPSAADITEAEPKNDSTQGAQAPVAEPPVEFMLAIAPPPPVSAVAGDAVREDAALTPAVDATAIDSAVATALSSDAPPPSTVQADAVDLSAPEESPVHAGEAQDGVELAGVSLMETSGTADLGRWLGADMILLEVQTRHGVFLASVPTGAQGDPYNAMQFTRLESLTVDPRSQLRLSGEILRVIPKHILEARLAVAHGVYEIETIKAFLTTQAAAAILEAQEKILTNLEATMPEIVLGHLRLTFCLTDRKMQLARAKTRDGKDIPVEASQCGA